MKERQLQFVWFQFFKALQFRISLLMHFTIILNVIFYIVMIFLLYGIFFLFYKSTPWMKERQLELSDCWMGTY